VGQKRTVKFVRRFLSKTLTNNLKFGTLLLQYFSIYLLKITQICSRSQTLLTFLSFLLTWRSEEFEALICHDFRLSCREWARITSTSSTKVNNYYCQYLLGDGLLPSSFIEEASATRAPCSRTARHRTLPRTTWHTWDWERNVHRASEQSEHKTSRLRCLRWPSPHGVSSATTCSSRAAPSEWSLLIGTNSGNGSLTAPSMSDVDCRNA